MTSNRALIAIFLVVFLVCLGLGAAQQEQVQQQQPSQPQATSGEIPVIKSEARLVLVDAVVTDKKGNYIPDLTQKDFHVWEDDTEQTIKSFSFGNWAQPERDQARYLVLFFDNSNMTGAEQVRAREAATKFIAANAAPNRYMAVMDFGGTLHVAQNFTGDAERLAQVVKDVKFSSVAGAQASAPVASIGSPVPGVGVPVGVRPTAIAGFGAPVSAVNTSLLMNAQADYAARTLLLALRSVAKQLAAIPGRKSLVLLSAGFTMAQEQQSELVAAIAACNKANVAIYPIDVRGLTGLTHPAELEMPSLAPPMRLVPATLRYSDAVPRLVYVSGEGMPEGQRGGGHSGGGGHVGGSRVGAGTGGPSAAHRDVITGRNTPRQLLPVIPRTTNPDDVLEALAVGTGGFLIKNSNALLDGMNKIAAEQSAYYVLGYTPATSSEGSCHTLKVKVSHSGADVRSRSYYCNIKPTDPLLGKPVEKLLEARAHGDNAGNVAATLRAPYFYTSPNIARVELAIEIPAGAVAFTKQKGKYTASIDILGLAYKPDGSVGARFSDTVPLEFESEKQVQDFSKGPLHYNHSFEAAPGNYNVKVVFACGADKFAKLETPLVIDAYDGKQLAISGVAFSKEVYPVAKDPDVLVAALLEDRSALVSRGYEFVPSGSDRFTKGEPGAFYLEIYDPLLQGDKPPQLNMQVKIVDVKTGASKLDATGAVPEIKAGNPVVPLGLNIPLDTLEPGKYRLEIRATDSAGNATPARSMGFEVN